MGGERAREQQRPDGHGLRGDRAPGERLEALGAQAQLQE